LLYKFGVLAVCKVERIRENKRLTAVRLYISPLCYSNSTFHESFLIL